MRLSDIMSHMNLTTYPIIGLVIFLIVFVAVSARALSRRYAAEYQRASTMPLSDDAAIPTNRASSTNSTGEGR